MFKAFNQLINEQNILSSINFMKIADIIYAATLSDKDLKEFSLNNVQVLEKSNGLSTFINLEFEISDNHIIYCHADFLEGLFKFLKNTKANNLILISSQSDRRINKRVYRKKPNNVKKWYGVNINYKSNELIPIPLGIAPYRNSKSVIYEDFVNLDNQSKKSGYLYSNFNVNTNYFHRKKAENSLKKLDIGTNLDFTDYQKYLENLSTYSFALAPWGNGIDTHRFWEAIYCETIPVTKKHYLYESFENVPKVLVKSYSNLLNLPIYKASNNDTNIPITLNYWEEIIKTNSNKIIEENIKFKISKLDINLSIKLFEKLINKRGTRKKVFTFLRKLSNKINNFLNVLSFKS